MKEELTGISTLVNFCSFTLPSYAPPSNRGHHLMSTRRAECLQMLMSCLSVLNGYCAQALSDMSCRRRVHDLGFK